MADEEANIQSTKENEEVDETAGSQQVETQDQEPAAESQQEVEEGEAAGESAVGTEAQAAEELQTEAAEESQQETQAQAAEGASEEIAEQTQAAAEEENPETQEAAEEDAPQTSTEDDQPEAAEGADQETEAAAQEAGEVEASGEGEAQAVDEAQSEAAGEAQEEAAGDAQEEAAGEAQEEAAGEAQEEAAGEAQEEAAGEAQEEAAGEAQVVGGEKGEEDEEAQGEAAEGAGEAVDDDAPKEASDEPPAGEAEDQDQEKAGDAGQSGESPEQAAPSKEQTQDSSEMRQEAAKIAEEIIEKAVEERKKAMEESEPQEAAEQQLEQPEAAAPRAPTPPEERERREQAAMAEEAQRQRQEQPEADEEDEEDSLSSLRPVWAFGMNRQVPVISLATAERDLIFYACANSAILFDAERNRQKILRGHTNAITCTAASNDKRWLVTGDAGEDSVVIIWDSRTATPVRTMFDPHPCGVVAVALNPNSRYLCTLSAEQDQTFAIWDWTTGDELSMCTATLSRDYGVQRHISFNPDDHSHVVTNSDHQVLFFQWGEGKVEYFAPPLTDKDFNKPVGRYCHSVFLRRTTKAISATSQGLCVVWDSNRPLTKMSTEATPDKRAVKLVPLHERSITVLTQTEDLIVTGDSAGHVKFFDQSLQLLYWYQHFKFGSVNSISFKLLPLPGSEEESRSLKSQRAAESQYDSDATIPANPFFVRDFVMGTSMAVFASVDVKECRAHIIHRDFDSHVYALDVHPSQTKVAMGGFSGYLKIWNYKTKLTECSRHIEGGSKMAIRSIRFDPSGEFLAVGHSNGVLRILDADTLSDILDENFHYSRDAITHIVFSEDSTLLATADAEFTTSLYQREIPGRERQWSYVGRNRAHYKSINDLIFGVQIDTGFNRLLSVGRDRYLVEYDIPNASKDNLPLLSADRVEQSGVPLCMAWYPPIVKEQFLVTANDEYKYKLFNCTTKKCRNTFLGPTFGSPVQQMRVLPHPGAAPSDRRYVVFALHDKVGLTILPLDGNPHNSVASIAHPQGVGNLACSPDGKFVFTAGGSDCTVQMWSVHTAALDAQSQLGGEDLLPFYSLLDGGREGDLFKELEDYFYYAQLRSQGIDSMETRKVSERIPISEIPFVMRGLGFYPSEQEIDNMMNEIKFSKYVDTGEYATEIDLGQFIRLYINHRPVFGLSVERIVKAFEVLGEEVDGEPTVDRGEVLDLLQNNGEHMTEYELAEYLTTLLGFNPEGGSFELEEFDPSTAGELIEKHIPSSIGVGSFVEDLLGFGPVRAAGSRASSSKPGSRQQQQRRPRSVKIDSSAQT